jgi:acyl transferase domain-containing protein/acyl carrier protein
MSNIADRFANLSPLKRAFLALQEAQSKLDALERAQKEPIAIVGMGCRFPGGADDPGAFFRLLRDGVDAVTEVPPERWDRDAWYDPDPDAPGKAYTRCGAFLRGVDLFDAPFFGISPREAARMDPQQRLLLEVSWEALEDACIAPDRLAGSQSGVFIGAMTRDYAHLSSNLVEPDGIDAYTGTGVEDCFAAGRISHALGLQGPSMTVETACSSALVAVHLGCQSLRAGECSVVLAGGVNLILSPMMHVITSKVRALSPDGRCKTFDAAADGYGRGEGCGVVVLKRLGDALRDGDRVLALIRGSAVNHDGPSGGLTVPNGRAQQQLLRDALASAGVMGSQVSYVEAHGTGTPLGDPIEMRALGATLGAGRSPEERLWVGSVKTNLGHLEAAAGVAGLMKVVLSLEHEEIPPHLHLEKLNPHISLDEARVAIPTERTPWPAGARPRIAGVSSFGVSGTNAHVVLEEGPRLFGVEPRSERPVHLVCLSARSAASLRALSERMAAHLGRHPEQRLGDVCFSANTGRARFGHRLSVVGRTAEEMRQRLTCAAQEREVRGVFRGQCEPGRGAKVAFLFTGQGAQYAGMGRELYETQPVFRRTLEQCDEQLRPYLGQSLLTVLYGEGEQSAKLLDETAYTQPALFSLEVALASVWRSWGVEPALVLGHSVGEYAAACVAGMMRLSDGLRLVTERGRRMQELPAEGAMAAVLAGESQVRQALSPWPEQVEIAGLNSPEETMLTGGREAIEQALVRLSERGLRTRRIEVSHAFHSAQVEPMLEQFEQLASQVSYQRGTAVLVSNVSGGRIEAEGGLSGGYWRRQARGAVRFAQGMATLVEEGCELFVEVGPGTTLLGLGRQSVGLEVGTWAASLRKGRRDWQQMLESAGVLYTRGVEVDLGQLEAPHARRKQALPTYPFERERHWVPTRAARVPRAASPSGASPHPLLGQRLRTAQVIFESSIAARSPAFLGQHCVLGVAIVPAAAYMEMALAAAAAVFGAGPHVLHALTLHQALALDERAERTVQLNLTERGLEEASFQIWSLASEDPCAGELSSSPPARGFEATWVLHASGNLRAVRAAAVTPALAALAPEALCARLRSASVEAHYERLEARGILLGASFRGLRDLFLGDGEALGRIDLPPSSDDEHDAYALHPAILDGCLQVLGALMADEDGPSAEPLRIPTGVERAQIHVRRGHRVWCYARLTSHADGESGACRGELRVVDDEGRLVAEIDGLESRRVERDALLPRSRAAWSEWLYHVRWLPSSRLSQASRRTAPGYLRSVSEIAAQVEPKVAALTDAHSVDRDGEMEHELDALSLSYAQRALCDLGLDGRSAAPTEAFLLAEGAGIAPQHRRLFGRILEMCASHPEPMPLSDPEARREALLARAPAFRAELTLLCRCGERLAEVLRGKQDPLPLLFPDGEVDSAAALYQDAPSARAANLLVAEAVAAAIERLPPGRSLRILEIGAGTGGTTFHVLPRLPAERVEYVFTDVGPRFLARAERKFAAQPGLRTRSLDVERDPEEQGFAPGSFDMIIAANVLHATRDLRETLGHVRRLLAPAGLLFVLEGTEPRRWVDLIFGLTEGWWRFTDVDLRARHPLLSRQRWIDLLAEMDFGEAAALPVGAAQRATCWAHQAVLVARAKGAVEAALHEVVEPPPRARAAGTVANVTAASPSPSSSRGPEVKAPGRWLIFADAGGHGQRLAERLRAVGDRCALIVAAEGEARSWEHRDPLRIDPLDPQHAERLVREVVAKDDLPCRGIVHLWGLDTTPASRTTLEALTQEQARLCGSVLHLVRALAGAGSGSSPRLWLVTRGATRVGIELPEGIAAATLWGMGRVIAEEHPELWGGLLDLDPDAAPEQSVMLLEEEIRQRGEDDHIAFRAGQRYVARMLKSPAPEVRGEPLCLRADSTYLVTGGLKGLGLEVARFMVERGARHLVLSGRSGPSEAAAGTLRSLEAMGARVKVARMDVAQRSEVAAVLAEIRRGEAPLRGVIHAAGLLRDGVLTQQSWDRFATVLAPKVEGTWNLHAESLIDPLDFFVLFSSTAALLGSAGQANHAAANAFMDALSTHRRASGRPSLSINWGAWSETGSVARREVTDRLLSQGIEAIKSRAGIGALEQVFESAEPQIAIVPARWSTYLERYRGRPVPSLLAALARDERFADDDRASDNAPSLLRRLAEAKPADRGEILVAHLRAIVLRILGRRPTDALPEDQGFQQLGMDSLMSLELRNAVQASLGRSLPATLALNYPTIEALAAYLSAELSILPPPVSAAPVEAAAAPAEDAEIADVLSEVLSMSEEDAQSALRDRA